MEINIKNNTNNDNINNLPIGFKPIEIENPIDNEIKIIKDLEWENTINPILDSIENFNENLINYGDYPYFKKEKIINFIPMLTPPSKILNENQIKEIHKNLPYYNQYENWNKIFSINENGHNFKTFYNIIKNYKNLIFIIKDEQKNVFGSFSNEIFQINKFFGTPETFLFTFYFQKNKISVYNSTKKNENYVFYNNEILAFGCSDNFFSLTIEKDFSQGYSKYTKTFNNKSLCGPKEKFTIFELEVYSFGD